MTTHGFSWPLTTPSTEMLTGVVHVWRVTLDLSEEQLCMVTTMLSLEECERAKQFYFSHDNHRFIIAHAALRLLLSNSPYADKRVG